MPPTRTVTNLDKLIACIAGIAVGMLFIFPKLVVARECKAQLDGLWPNGRPAEFNEHGLPSDEPFESRLIPNGVGIRFGERTTAHFVANEAKLILGDQLTCGERVVVGVGMTVDEIAAVLESSTWKRDFARVVPTDDVSSSHFVLRYSDLEGNVALFVFPAEAQPCNGVVLRSSDYGGPFGRLWPLGYVMREP